MRKRNLITAFGICAIMGVAISFTNLKTIKSLIDQNIEALTWSYDNVSIKNHFIYGEDDSSNFKFKDFTMSGGSWGFVWGLSGHISHEDLYAYCKIREADVNAYRNYFSNGFMFSYCSQHCSQTTYCPSNL